MNNKIANKTENQSNPLNYINGEAGAVALPAAIVDIAVDGTVIPLGQTDNTFQIIVRPSPLLPDAPISICWAPADNQFIPGPLYSDTHYINADDIHNGQVVFHIPVDTQLIPYSEGSAVVYYLAYNNYSDFTTLNIARQSEEFRTYSPAPVIQEANDGFLSYDVSEVHVVISLTKGAAVGDVITLVWYGYDADGVQTISTHDITISVDAASNGYATVFLYPGDVAPYLGGRIETYYEISRDGIVTQTSARTLAAVALVQTQVDLFRPYITEANGHIVLPSDLGTEFTLLQYLQSTGLEIVQQEGDVVTYYWRGFSGNGEVANTLPAVTHTLSADDIT